MGRAACEHAAYGLADAPTPDLAFESFLARTLYGRNLAELRWIVAKRVRAPYRAGRQLAWGTIKNREYSERAAVEWPRR